MMTMKVTSLQPKAPRNINDNFGNADNNDNVASVTFGDQGPPSSTLPHPVSSVALEVEQSADVLRYLIRHQYEGDDDDDDEVEQSADVLRNETDSETMVLMGDYILGNGDVFAEYQA